MRRLYWPAETAPLVVKPSFHDLDSMRGSPWMLLRAAFVDLNGQGIVARHHLGGTMSDASDLIDEAIEAVRASGQRVVGYAFYHSQDLGHCAAQGTLHLAFNGRDDAPLPDTRTSSVQDILAQFKAAEERLRPLTRSVGRAIVSTLERHGIKVR